MKKIKMPSHEIPVSREVDVLVVGGGYAGFGAAICAARNGAETMLVEQLSALGGLVTMGYVGLTFSYIEGVAYELFRELNKVNAVKGRFLDLEKTKVVLEQMLKKAGVRILYNTSVIDTIVEDNKIKGVVTFNKSGKQAVLAKRVIDASGDGDVAAYAGVPFECGCPELNNYNQASSLVCRIGNVNFERYKAGDNLQELWLKKIQETFENKEFPYVIDKRVNWMVVVPGREKEHQEVLLCFAHSRKCKCLDAEDLSRQLIEQREQNQWIIEFCRKNIPGFENAWLIDTAPLLGVRDSRRIMCEYKVTGSDLVDARRFPDAVMRGSHAFDAHHPTEPGHIKHIVRKNDKGEDEKFYVIPGTWREIPYRAIVPLKIDNMLVAGRNFSSDFMGQSGNRLVMECFNMGQAAGTAAALSIKDNVAPRKLDVQKLRKRLIEMGVNLEKEPKYGSSFISTETKVKKEDLLMPENNKTGQAALVLKEEKRSAYKHYTSEEEERDIAKHLEEAGYTNTGGDVGTNLE